MKCERHIWDTNDRDWCWKCEELTLKENRERYENKLRNNSLQRIGGDKETSTVSTTTQKSE
jgi:hypothetical protein